jgi:stage II sporulation protein D
LATTAADRRIRWAGLGAAVALAGCPRIEVGGLPEVATAEPTLRVGLAIAQSEVTIGGGGPLVISGPDGGGIVEVSTGSTAVVSGNGATVRARVGGVFGSPMPAMTVRPADSAGAVRVGGREYRGDVLITPTPTGLLAVNLVSIEGYVAGVVNAEMGRRPPGDSQAVYAQAVISRTVAMRALGRYRIRGYDLVSTIADQAYGGVQSETAMGWAAVTGTRGEVVTNEGAVIEAFFFSTCGGRTEAVEEVFSGSAQPYLRSVSDRDPAGQAYCAISPRFRWREEWSGESLGRILSANARIAGLDAEAALRPADLQVSGRSVAGRAAELMLLAGGRAQAIRGQQVIRQTMRLADGGWLRSTQFSVQVTRAGGRIVRMAAEGGGNGHGVGMCQWGAVGRARAGASYQEILAAYFPGTEVRRLY